MAGFSQSRASSLSLVRHAPTAGLRLLPITLVILAGALVAPSVHAQPSGSAPSTVESTSTAPAPVTPRAATAAGPTATPTPSASASTTAPTFDVRLHEKVVFSLHAARAGQSGPERARAASHALESVLDDPEQPLAHVEEQPGSAVLFVGKTPLATLGDDDAKAA